MKKKIGTKWQFQPYDELKYAGKICEIIKELDDEFDYQVKFDDGHIKNVQEEELGWLI